MAGGCNGWCAKNKAVSTAEMYDPETNSWTRVRDLPEPLSSAQMTLFDGLPTIVGGYNNVARNKVLYQYHPQDNEWRPHPTTQLRLARSSPAVMQVPRQTFYDC